MEDNIVGNVFLVKEGSEEEANSPFPFAKVFHTREDLSVGAVARNLIEESYPEMLIQPLVSRAWNRFGKEISSFVLNYGDHYSSTFELIDPLAPVSDPDGSTAKSKSNAAVSARQMFISLSISPTALTDDNNALDLVVAAPSENFGEMLKQAATATSNGPYVYISTRGSCSTFGRVEQRERVWRLEVQDGLVVGFTQRQEQSKAKKRGRTDTNEDDKGPQKKRGRPKKNNSKEEEDAPDKSKDLEKENKVEGDKPEEKSGPRKKPGRPKKKDSQEGGEALGNKKDSKKDDKGEADKSEDIYLDVTGERFTTDEIMQLCEAYDLEFFGKRGRVVFDLSSIKEPNKKSKPKKKPVSKTPTTAKAPSKQPDDEASS